MTQKELDFFDKLSLETVESFLVAINDRLRTIAAESNKLCINWHQLSEYIEKRKTRGDV